MKNGFSQGVLRNLALKWPVIAAMAVLSGALDAFGGVLGDKIRQQVAESAYSGTTLSEGAGSAESTYQGTGNQLVVKKKISSSDERSDLNVSPSSPDASAGSGSTSSSMSLRQMTDMGGNYGITVGGMSSQDVLNLSTDEILGYIGSMHDSDESRARAQDIRNDRMRFINTVANSKTRITATVGPADFATDHYDSTSDWKLFLHDWGLKDFSEINYTRAGGESVSAESVASSGALTYDISQQVFSGGVMSLSGDLVGSVQVKTSKVRSVSGVPTVDMTVQVVSLGGKTAKATIKAVAMEGQTSTQVDVPGWGAFGLLLGLDARGEFIGRLGDNVLASGQVGGDMMTDRALFTVDFSSGFGKIENVVGVLLPFEEEFTCSNKGKWLLAKASKAKFMKNGIGGYDLFIDQSRDKTNVAGLKLTYKPKTGRFSGSFKLYYVLAGASTRPALKSLTAKISGLVVDGVGNGVATIANKGLSWPVTIVPVATR